MHEKLLPLIDQLLAMYPMIDPTTGDRLRKRAIETDEIVAARKEPSERYLGNVTDTYPPPPQDAVNPFLPKDTSQPRTESMPWPPPCEEKSVATKTVKIYGASDDLLEVDGDLNEEFGCFDRPCTILFSDGTVVQGVYGKEGIWRITHESKPGVIANHVECSGDKDDEYTDVLTLTGPFEWVIEHPKTIRFDRLRDEVKDIVAKLTHEELEQVLLACIKFRAQRTK